MPISFSRQNFSTWLLLGFLVLIVLTTLSAGLPAFWLTQSQLERQAWSQVQNARLATLALLTAERERLANQLVLLAARPTLQQLAENPEVGDLQRYLVDFQRQSGLDLLVLCDPAQKMVSGDSALINCSADRGLGYDLVAGRPLIVARQTVTAAASEHVLGTVIGGIWLEEAFLGQMARGTGSQQSIVGPDGTRLASSFFTGDTVVDAADRQKLIDRSSTFYAVYTPLLDDDGQTVVISEVALNVDAMVLTVRNAFFILAGSTSLVAVLGSLLSITFVRQVNAPLKKLTATAEKIGAGDLMAAIPLFSRPVEVRTLATALHRSQASMLAAIQERSATGERLNALLQSIVEGVVSFDAAGLVTFWSAGASEILGWAASATIGRPVEEFFVPVEVENGRFGDHLPAAGQKKRIEVKARGGRRVILAITSSRGAAPTAAAGALVFRDVTEEETIRQLRSYFLSNIAHEFLTPISTLNASMELLLAEAEALTPAEVRQLIKPSHISLLGLQTLVINLLESSNMEAGQFVLRRRPCDIESIIVDAINIAGPLLDRRGQSLSRPAAGNLPTFNGDPARLTQVLVNLLVNASKYSAIGQPIELKVMCREQSLYVTVADRGPGIPAAERSAIFRSFVRLTTGDKETYGTGLGLFVVKTIVTAHGGAVGIEDHPGGGAIFWFTIPIEVDTNEDPGG